MNNKNNCVVIFGIQEDSIKVVIEEISGKILLEFLITKETKKPENFLESIRQLYGERIETLIKLAFKRFN